MVVTQHDQPAPAGDPTDRRRGFVVGLAGQGPDTPTPVSSLRHYEALYGDRDGGPTMWDAADVFFRLAPRAPLVVKRRLGAAKAKASVTLQDATPVNTLKLEALYHGDYANGASGGLKVSVAAGTSGGGTKKVTLKLDGVVVEVFDNLATGAAIVDALAGSAYARAVDLGPDTLPADVADVNFTGGAEDRAAVTDATLPADLATIGRELGIGQVYAPGLATNDAHEALIDHGFATNRHVILDGPVFGTDVPTTIAAAKALIAQVRARLGSHRAQVGSGRVQFSGPLPGTTRWVAASAVIAGRLAQSDETHHPIWASAGEVNGRIVDDRGRDVGALDVEVPLTPEQWTELYEAGINPIRKDRLGVLVYGARTVSSDARWRWVPDVRTAMWLQARLERLGGQFVGGEPTTIAKVRRLRTAALGEMDVDADAGAFWSPTGERGDAVFDFDVAVNTAETIAAGQLFGEASYTPSATTEQVVLGITAQPITQ